MTLQQLEYVIALNRFGHFANAADFCGVTQPTLSSMIQKLEEELGVKIFDRRFHPIRPTEAGFIIIEHAWQVLRQAEQLRHAVEEKRQLMYETFRIGVLPTIAPYLIPEMFQRMMAKYPGLDVRITEMKTSEIKAALRHGDIDAGIIARVEGLDSMNCHSLYYEQFYAYVSKTTALYINSSIKPSDLKKETLWLLEQEHSFTDQIVRFCQLETDPHSKRSYNLGNIETFMRIVEKGQGITFIPELMIRQLCEYQKLFVKPFSFPIPTREIIIVTGKDFLRKTMLQTIIDHIHLSVPKDMLTLRHSQQHVV